MKLSLKMEFHTDGDFSFEDIATIFDPSGTLYRGAQIQYSYETDDEYVAFFLMCEGEASPCRLAARDLMEAVVVSFRTFKYGLVKAIYDLIIPLKEGSLWSGADCYESARLSGNYAGTTVELKICCAAFATPNNHPTTRKVKPTKKHMFTLSTGKRKLCTEDEIDMVHSFESRGLRVADIKTVGDKIIVTWPNGLTNEYLPEDFR